MAKTTNWWIRKLHRWGAVLIAIPLLIVIVSGLLLQTKKQFAWIQPPTQKGSADTLEIGWAAILQKTSSVPEAQVSQWQDIDRIDVRPAKGVLKVRCRSGWEVQIDSATGELLSSSYRRSDLIESIHDGSFFSDAAKLWVFLPNGIVLLALWFTGAWLWYLPFLIKQRKAKQKKNNTSASQQGTAD